MTRETKWTPGPWFVSTLGIIRAGHPDRSAVVAAAVADTGPLSPGRRISIPEAKANAALIAAAPDLVAACEAMRTRLTTIFNADDACWHDWPGAYGVDAALAKARGS